VHAPVGTQLNAFGSLTERTFALAGEQNPVDVAAVPSLPFPAEAIADIAGAEFQLIDLKGEGAELHLLQHRCARGRHAVGREKAFGRKVCRHRRRRGIARFVGDGACGHGVG